MRERAPHYDKWRQYSKRFRDTAVGRGHEADYIDTCLSYAKGIILKGLPVIYDWNHFSRIIGLRPQYLYRACNFTGNHYRRFSILKASGGQREICEPLPNLKLAQRWILDNILDRIPISPAAKGFRRGLSIKDNARFHRNQRVVVRIDVKDFFPTIPLSRVRQIFAECGYSRSVSELLARLCTLDNCLPQGSPSSPALSNLVCRRLDARLLGYCRKVGVRYTRYADDLTFSGSFERGKLIRAVYTILKECGFEPNLTKTNEMHRGKQQRVTGIVVNEYLHIPRTMRRELRQVVYYIGKYGLDDHVRSIREERRNYLQHIVGQLQFQSFIDQTDAWAKASRERLISSGDYER